MVLRSRLGLLGLLAFTMLACAKESPPPETPSDVEPPPEPERDTPPEAATPKDLVLPRVDITELDNGLQVNTIAADQLPVVYATLVVRSGAEADPAKLPGLSGLVAQMLKEGTTKRTGAQIAEEIEFLGADLWTSSDEENTYVGVRSLAQHFEVAMSILAEVAVDPAFNSAELSKLKRRELDRLALSEREPTYVARRTFYRALYGAHPYGTVDTTPQAVKRVRRQDLTRWHRDHFVGKNAFLVVAGQVDPDVAADVAQRTLGSLRPGKRAVPVYDEPPTRTDRGIVVVDRPGSVQSVIYIGNLAIQRANREWIPLVVANQVLGGSAASRLFMDLREKRSLTYGAYSAIGERVDIGPFVAYSSVRTEVTPEAIGAFFEHLERIHQEPASGEELTNAKRYLSDSFPLQVDTPGKLAELVIELRTYGLPSDYWTNYRDWIRQTSASEAYYVARNYVRPHEALVVVVGQAADFAPDLAQFGPVTVVSPDGEIKAQFDDERTPPAGAPRGPIQ
jgi:zinc protease